MPQPSARGVRNGEAAFDKGDAGGDPLYIAVAGETGQRDADVFFGRKQFAAVNERIAEIPAAVGQLAVEEERNAVLHATEARP